MIIYTKLLLYFDISFPYSPVTGLWSWCVLLLFLIENIFLLSWSNIAAYDLLVLHLCLLKHLSQTVLRNLGPWGFITQMKVLGSNKDEKRFVLGGTLQGLTERGSGWLLTLAQPMGKLCIRSL